MNNKCKDHTIKVLSELKSDLEDVLDCHKLAHNVYNDGVIEGIDRTIHRIECKIEEIQEGE
jgi:hypothetical protein